MTVRVREVGDAALLLEIGSRRDRIFSLDRALNDRVSTIARAVQRRAIAGVRDIVPTFRSVVVMFDPLSTDVAAVAAALEECANLPTEAVSGMTHQVAVEYGGAAGPDLDAVAGHARCSSAAVIQGHASRAYRVFMLGFLPGFAYLGMVDEAIASPRRSTPRMHVPAGSVGIAGRQTGIYPVDSPGGWQIIGRANVRPFDSSRMPPALFAPGDEVRFVPVPAGTLSDVDGPERPRGLEAITTGARCITVLRPGLFTTVQDSGRWGYQALGVPVSGAMDLTAHRLANALVGNSINAATLEATWCGPELRMEQETRIAVAGADLQASLDGADLPLQMPVTCGAGSVLRFGGRRSGARAYVAFSGGVAVAPVLGSRATHVRSGLGGVSGRALQTGDCLALGEARGAVQSLRTAGPRPLSGGARLRVLPGPQVEDFDTSVIEGLSRTRYIVSKDSDRMGYRLTGGMPVASSRAGEMVSDAAFIGGLQIPPSGEPILLMADRPTTGGYPQIVVVITADMPSAAQLSPGDWVEFEVCSRADAIAALVAQEGNVLAIG